LLGHETIKAFTFKKKLMKKFLINDQGDWEKVYKIKDYEIIALFYQRFNK
jgi:hypothetical protein